MFSWYYSNKYLLKFRIYIFFSVYFLWYRFLSLIASLVEFYKIIIQLLYVIKD